MEPAPPAPPAPPPAGLPWEERGRVGFATGLVETIRLFVTEPGTAWTRTRRSGDLASPIFFAILLGWLGIALQSVWNLVFPFGGRFLLPEHFGRGLGFLFATSLFGLALRVILAPIFLVIGLFVASAIVHLFLMLFSGTKDSDAGFEGTLRSLAYSHVAQLALVVPIAGGLVAMVWAIFLNTLGLAALHRTSQGKALAALLLPLVLCCVCVALAFMGLFAAIFGAAAAAGRGH